MSHSHPSMPQKHPIRSGPFSASWYCRWSPVLAPLPRREVVMSTRIAFAVLVLAACVSTNAALLNPSLKLAPICPDGVQVFTDTSKVGKPYTEVAVLNSKGGSDVTSESGMINSQRKKAAGLGANGLILGTMKDPSTGARSEERRVGKECRSRWSPYH